MLDDLFLTLAIDIEYLHNSNKKMFYIAIKVTGRLRMLITPKLS